MATIDYLHICDYAGAGEHGKQIVIGIFDRLMAPSCPIDIPLMALALRVRGSAGEKVPLAMDLMSPHDVLITRATATVVLDEAGAAFLQAHLLSVQLPEAGHYRFVVMSESNVLASQDLQLVVEPRDSQPQIIAAEQEVRPWPRKGRPMEYLG